MKQAAGHEAAGTGNAHLLEKFHGHAGVADAGQLGGGVVAAPVGRQPVLLVGLILLGCLEVVGQEGLHIVCHCLDLLLAGCLLLL